MGRTPMGRRQVRFAVAGRRVELRLGEEEGGAQIGRSEVAATQIGAGEVGEPQI